MSTASGWRSWRRPHSDLFHSGYAANAGEVFGSLVSPALRAFSISYRYGTVYLQELRVSQVKQHVPNNLAMLSSNARPRVSPLPV